MSFIPWPIWGCNQKTSDKIQYKNHAGEILDEKDGYFVIHCKTCILNHVVPLPSSEFLSQYYANQFYQFSKADYIDRYEGDRDWWEMHHGYTITKSLDILNKRPYSAYTNNTRPSVLDVGTGPGIFLDVAKSKGFDTYGVEPSRVAADYARRNGHTIYTGTLADLLSTIERGHHVPRRYDMIHLYEVLEHVPDPENFLDVCRNLLTPGGVLHVVVPNDYSPLQLKAKEQYKLPSWWVSPPEHLNYFEPKTLQLMVRRVGFSVIDIRGTYPMETFLLRGDVYIGDDALGRMCHKERMRYEMKAFRRGEFEALMDEYRENMSDPYSGTVGREICLTAIKD